MNLLFIFSLPCPAEEGIDRVTLVNTWCQLLCFVFWFWVVGFFLGGEVVCIFLFFSSNSIIWSRHSFIVGECFIDVIFNFEQAMWFHLTDWELCICSGFLFFFLLEM